MGVERLNRVPFSLRITLLSASNFDDRRGRTCAVGGLGGLVGPGKRRHQQRRENRNDRNYHKQFDQGEAPDRPEPEWKQTASGSQILNGDLW